MTPPDLQYGLPDLGPVRFLNHEAAPGTPFVNMAGVLDLARTAGTPQAKCFLQAFATAWARLASTPGSAGDKQMAAFREALRAVETRFPPSQGTRQ